MAIKFGEEPCEGVLLKGLQVLRKPHVPGIQHKTEPKMIFSAEPVRSLAGRGCWFEMRIDSLAGGEMSPMGIGFTGTDPETLKGEAAPALPGCAGRIPKSYVCGYARSLYWNGEKREAASIFSRLAPARTFTIGALANVMGGLEIFINRRLVLSYAPEDLLERIDLEQPIWAVVDASAGLKKAVLVPDSVPPSPEEANAPEGQDQEPPQEDEEDAEAAE
ncbi:unnamed protein product [Effrenium voratum]|nr:unnamed protein product [Effrenium voratum]